MIKYDAEYIVNHINEFYVTKKNSVYPYKKEDILATLDINDLETFRPWCKEFDIAFYLEELGKQVRIYNDITSIWFQRIDSVFGKYLSTMKLSGYKNFTYADSDDMNKWSEIRRKRKLENESNRI